jgi:hypothetical protein
LCAGLPITHKIEVGRSFHICDWTGVSPIGEFSIVSPYVWDASRLYTAGEITIAGVTEASSLTLLALALSSLLLRRLRCCHRPGIAWAAGSRAQRGLSEFTLVEDCYCGKGGDAKKLQTVRGRGV